MERAEVVMSSGRRNGAVESFRAKWTVVNLRTVQEGSGGATLVERIEETLASMTAYA